MAHSPFYLPKQSELLPLPATHKLEQAEAPGLALLANGGVRRLKKSAAEQGQRKEPAPPCAPLIFYF